MDTMIRTQLSLPKNQRRAVNELIVWKNISLAEAYRRAMDKYLQLEGKQKEDRKALAERLAGAWKNSPNWKNVDASDWQRKLRRDKGI